MRLYLDPESLMEPEKSVAGSAEQMRQRMSELADAGVRHVLLDPVAGGGAAGRLDAVRGFMADVAA